MLLSFELAATICSHLSARHKRNRKLLRLWRMTELVVDDTPSLPVTGNWVCVCLFTAGITGQDCMWSEAGRQLVEWGASVAGGYKVSFQRHTRDHPAPPPHTRSAVFYLSLKLHTKRTTSRQNDDQSKEKCHVHNFEINTNTHDSLGRERITNPVYWVYSVASAS